MKNIGPNDADADIYKPSRDLSIYFNDNIDGCMYLRWIFILIPILQYIIQQFGLVICLVMIPPHLYSHWSLFSLVMARTLMFSSFILRILLSILRISMASATLQQSTEGLVFFTAIGVTFFFFFKSFL